MSREESPQEESCATCVFWNGAWYGKDNISSFAGVDTLSYAEYSDSEKETFGTCRRYPPARTKTRILRSHYQLKDWERWDKKVEDEVCELSEEIKNWEEALDSATEDWDKKWAAMKLKKAVEKLEQIKKVGHDDWQKRLLMLDTLAPEKTFEVGEWIVTSRLDWCGEYKSWE